MNIEINKEAIERYFTRKWEQIDISILLGLLLGCIDKEKIDNFKNQVRINNIIIYNKKCKDKDFYRTQNYIIVQAIVNASPKADGYYYPFENIKLAGIASREINFD